MGLLLETVAVVRAAVGPKLAVSIRFPVSEMVENGLKYKEVTQVAQWTVAKGAVDLLDFSGDWAGMFATAAGKSNPDPPEGSTAKPPKEGSFLNYVQVIRASFPGVPVITASGFETKLAMHTAVSTAATDMVGIGRAFIKPGWGSEIKIMLDSSLERAPIMRSNGPTDSMRDLRWVYWQLHLTCNGGDFDTNIDLKKANENLEAYEKDCVQRYHSTFPVDMPMWAHPNPAY